MTLDNLEEYLLVGTITQCIELKKCGKHIPVTLDDLEEYHKVGTVTLVLSLRRVVKI